MAAALLRALSLPFVLKSPATSAAAGPAEAAAETDQLAEGIRALYCVISVCLHDENRR